MSRRNKDPRRFACPAAAVAVLAVGALHAQPASLPEGYVRNPPVEPGLAPNMAVEQRPAEGRVFEIRFSEGDEILSGLTDLAERHGIASAHVTGLGGLSSAMLAFGDPSIGAFVFKQIPIDEKSELVSLVGTVSLRDGEPYVHLHAVVALSDGSTRGGHVLRLDVAPVAEVSLVATATTED